MNLKNALAVTFTFRRLPRQYADIDKASRYISYVAYAVAGYFWYHSQILLGVVVALSVFFAGRLAAALIQERYGSMMSPTATAWLGRVERAVFIIVSAPLLALTLYWYWASGDPVFLLEAFIAAAVLAWAAATAGTRMAMGTTCVILAIGSGAFAWHYQSPKFLVAVAFAAFIAWALLFRGRRARRGFLDRPASDTTS